MQGCAPEVVKMIRTPLIRNVEEFLPCAAMLFCFAATLG